MSSGRLARSRLSRSVCYPDRLHLFIRTILMNMEILPSPSRVAVQLAKAHHPASAAGSEDAAFDIFLHFIALQLLASCYTLLPASSAEGVPLLQQRKGSRLVTALRLHSYRRFSPAAGYHAREPSETLAWPGLYSGPSLEDQAAEIATRQRRLKRRSLEVLQNLPFPRQAELATDASQWSDGPADRCNDGRVSRGM